MFSLNTSLTDINRHPFELFLGAPEKDRPVELHICHLMMGLGGDRSWEPMVCAYR